MRPSGKPRGGCAQPQAEQGRATEQPAGAVAAQGSSLRAELPGRDPGPRPSLELAAPGGLRGGQSHRSAAGLALGELSGSPCSSQSGPEPGQVPETSSVLQNGVSQAPRPVPGPAAREQNLPACCLRSHTAPGRDSRLQPRPGPHASARQPPTSHGMSILPGARGEGRGQIHPRSLRWGRAGRVSSPWHGKGQRWRRWHGGPVLWKCRHLGKMRAGAESG